MLQEKEGAVISSTITVSHIDAAVEYAKQGFYIFPCQGSGTGDWKEAKKPLIKGWPENASNDPEQVKKWWAQWPDAFIGLLTGPMNHLTVIDVDSEEDKEFVGLLMHHAEMLDCPVVKTSKGQHVYFAYHPTLNTSTGKRKGIDIRSAGGYVIAAPSSHTPTGYGYELMQGELTNVCPVPDAVLKALMPKEMAISPSDIVITRGDATKIRQVLMTIPSDNRDDWIFAGMALKNDFGEMGFDLWNEWSETSAKYNPSEMQYIWDSFSKNSRSKKVSCGTIYYLAKQRGVGLLKEDKALSQEGWSEPLPLQSNLLPVKPLIPEMLPEPIRDWVADIAELMNCPVDYVAVDSVVALGGLIGSRCRIQPKQYDTGWKVVPNLWGVVVAEPGMKKSPALDASLEFIYDMERQNHDAYREAKALFEAQLEEYKNKPDELKKGTGKLELPIKPEEPAMKRHLVKTSTVEKLGEIAGKNPQGLIVLADELPALLSKLEDRERYVDRGFYLEAWKGDSYYSFDTIGRGSTYIPNLCLSVLGNIQPEKLQQYVGNVRDQQNNDGMIQRFQMLVYPDVPKFAGIIDRAPNVSAKDKAKRLFVELAQKDFSTLGARMEDEKPVFKFSSEAQPVMIEWLNQLEEKILRPDDEPLVQQHLSKYRSLMPSLALIFHLATLVSENRGGDVSLEAIYQAIAWCDYLESHARRVYAGRNGNDYGTVQLAKMIQAGKLGEVFFVRDVYRNEPSGLSDARKAQRACQALEALGWLKAGERPGNKYQVNPKLIKAQTLH